MKKAGEFARGRRGAVVSTRGKTRITIYLDDAIVERFKALSAQTGKGYQTLINEVLAAYGAEDMRPASAAQIRKIVREELAAKGA
jgi:uncharacterized protein (DUF4415 family)